MLFQVMGADPRKLEAAIRKHAGAPSQSSSASATYSEPDRALPTRKVVLLLIDPCSELSQNGDLDIH